MAKGSALPGVISALVAGIPTVPAFDGVDVHDGTPVTRQNSRRYLLIGASETGETSGFTRVRSQLGDTFHDEVGFVRCILVAQDGTAGNLAQHRADAVALADAVEAWLDADVTLGGVLSQDATWAVEAAFDPVQNEKGSALGILLTLTYTTTTY